MKIAIVGSRSITKLDLRKFIPPEVCEIVSGGSRGVDSIAHEYAKANNIPLIEILPDYPRYGRSAPIRRNDIIIDTADKILIFWDGVSHGSEYVIKRCEKINKPYVLYKQGEDF